MNDEGSLFMTIIEEMFSLYSIGKLLRSYDVLIIISIKQ